MRCNNYGTKRANSHRNSALRTRPRRLDRIIGALFREHRDVPLRSQAVKAMRGGSPFDDRRIDLFATLQQALLAGEPVPGAPRAAGNR